MWEAISIIDLLDRGGRALITGLDMIRDTSKKVDLIQNHILMD